MSDIDCEPLAAYETLYGQFAGIVRGQQLPVSERELRLAAWVALEELLSRLAPPGNAHGILQDPSPANCDRALALAATQDVRLAAPAEAPRALRFAYRLADALLEIIRTHTTVH